MTTLTTYEIRIQSDTVLATGSGEAAVQVVADYLRAVAAALAPPGSSGPSTGRTPDQGGSA